MSLKKLSLLSLLALSPACREYQPEPVAADTTVTTTASLVGRVIMEDSGSPPAQVACEMNGDPCSVRLHTDASFELEGVPEGDVVIDFFAQEGTARLNLEDVRAAGVYRVWLVLGPSPRVEMYPRDREQEDRRSEEAIADFEDGSAPGGDGEAPGAI